VAIGIFMMASCAASSRPGSSNKKKACDCPKYNVKRFGEPKKHY
jgi:hypothetical protein